MTIPSIMESESVAGYAKRSALLRLERTAAPFMREALGVSRPRASAPTGNLAKLASVTGGVLGSVIDIVEKHTPIAASMHLTMPLNRRQELFERLQGGDCFDRELRYAALGKGPHRIHFPAAYCQICARSDEERCGFPYWHIEWEYTGVAACPIHRVSLTLGCGRCRESQLFCSGLRLPSTECFCGNHAKPLLPVDSRELEAHVRIATLLMQAQKSKRFYADECDLGAMFRQRARDLGFTRGPLLDRVSMFEHFRDRYGDELLKSLGFIESGRKPTFVHELSAARKQTGLLRVAYLIDFFYEHFNEFEASVTAFASSGAEPKLCGRPPRGRTFSGQKLALATGRVKDYLRENPETTRTELLAKCRHAACYLMLHDRETYEAVMPPTRRRIGYGASRAQRMAQLDDALLKHIQMRRELLRSGPMHEWRRLSVWTLLMGHPSARSFYSLKQDLPKSSAAIKSILIDPV